jgi:hypothetical protein
VVNSKNAPHEIVQGKRIKVALPYVQVRNRTSAAKTQYTAMEFEPRTQVTPVTQNTGLAAIGEFDARRPQGQNGQGRTSTTRCIFFMPTLRRLQYPSSAIATPASWTQLQGGSSPGLESVRWNLASLTGSNDSLRHEMGHTAEYSVSRLIAAIASDNADSRT